jgi:hypothetical protein
MKSLGLSVGRKTALLKSWTKELYHWFFLAGPVLVVTVARFIVSESNSEIYSLVFSVTATIASLLFFAYTMLRERAVRHKEAIAILKTQHTDFFEWVNSEVDRLLQVDRINEESLTRRYQ